MSETSKKKVRDRSVEFKGFLNDLQDWDYLRDGKDINQKGRDRQNNKLIVDGNKASSSDRSAQFDYLKYADPIGQISGINYNDQVPPDASSEKELGNECFKQKKFSEAIDCYSRSIALSPTSVAFANRAMAYLKLKRYEEAESDCTEALNLDDRYVKAYSRRATARKELGKLKAALEDADFAVRLEPNNNEVRKQYSETKALYEKEITKRNSESLKSISKGSEPPDSFQTKSKIVKDDYLVSSKTQKVATNEQNSGSVQMIQKRSEGAQTKYELKEPLQDVASRAASRALESAAVNLTAPKSAYEFEVSWRALSDDSARQMQLLKMIPPATLPHIFKNALSAPILVDIIKCVTTFFKEDSELAIGILDNMTRVPRFDMLMMCISARDRSEINRMWGNISSCTTIPASHREAVAQLRTKYCNGEDHMYVSNGWSK
ncbi:RNA polymerase II-associated protein 3-like [Zingiber officinale]|uniref:RNA-polymerase II-associated protein 3-like C-terminal domain-containing protein n=1 Tax=Zingiber officinale TaxID=94328 RepID=A0A8J5HWP0_ZINOF|nr:RNA polymerase II-associated protein 3-like [Zingiber officinale]KAG6537202.1 hypothetical protein ZIOFF_002288 [Zingiber officinale]